MTTGWEDASRRTPLPVPPLLLLLVVAVITGVLAMHGFSAGHHPSTGTVTEQEQAATPVVHSPSLDDGGAVCPAPGCGGDRAVMTTVCLFLVLVMVLTAPRRGGARWRRRDRWGAARGPAPPLRPALPSSVSRVELCVSRT